MWKRIRRRTMAPSRPAVYPEQIGLLLITLVAIGGGLWAVIRIL